MEVLELKTSVVPGTIVFNNEAVKEDIKRQIAEFDGSTFNEESIQTGKAIVADLRKRIKEAKEVDKQVKVMYLKPYEEFHNKVLELTTLVEKPIEDINAQLDEMELRRKEEKHKKIQEIYTECIDGFEDYIPLKKIYNKKWENKTVSLSTVKAEINNIVDSVSNAVNAITAMNSEAVQEALKMYKTDLSLVNAITYINNYEQRKVEILEREKERQRAEQERKKQAEIEKAKEEERQRIIKKQQAELEKQRQEEMLQRQIEQAREEERQRVIAEQEQARQREIEAMSIRKRVSPTNLVNYKIIATNEEFEQIEMYLNSIGVQFIKGDF